MRNNPVIFRLRVNWILCFCCFKACWSCIKLLCTFVCMYIFCPWTGQSNKYTTTTQHFCPRVDFWARSCRFYWCIKDFKIIQCRHLVLAPVDRTSASAWLYKHPWMNNMSKKQINDPRSLPIKVTFRSMPRKLGGESGMWSCFMPRQPRHLMQESDIGHCSSRYNLCNSL